MKISIHAPARGATFILSRSASKVKISIHAPARGATVRSSSLRIGFEKFQSTLPRGERPHPLSLLQAYLPDFNPRSREGSDRDQDLMIVSFVISIHAPARGATGSGTHSLSTSNNFNPRSREGSDSLAVVQVIISALISIHAPARGATVDAAAVRLHFAYFNPRSREGSDAG